MKERSATPLDVYKGANERLIGRLFLCIGAGPLTLSQYRIRPDLNEIGQFSCHLLDCAVGDGFPEPY